MNHLGRLMMLCLLTLSAAAAGAGEIHEAVAAGDLARVERLVDGDAAVVFERDDNAMRDLPLHTAAIHGRAEIARFLLDHGADIDGGDIDNSTPLGDAAVTRNVEMARLLLARGASVNRRDNKGDTPLSFALSANEQEIIDLLLAAGADLYYRSPGGRTLLHNAALVGNLDMVDRMIALGEPIDAKADGGMTALTYAAGSASLEMVRKLVELGASLDPNPDDIDIWTPISRAVGLNRIENARYLASRGARLTGVVDTAGNTLLTDAGPRATPEMATFLIENGVDIDAVNDRGETALIKAVIGGNGDLTKTLLAAGARQDAHRLPGGGAPLHIAAAQGNIDIVTALADAGADLEAQTATGITPLRMATRYGHAEVAAILAERGARGSTAVNAASTLAGQGRLGRKEAVVWHLGHAGWAVKTRDHLLIIDYFADFGAPSSSPGLANGHVDPEELKDARVTVFSTHAHGDHYHPSIFDWADEVKEISYAIGCEGPDGADYVRMTPRQDFRIDGMKVKTINSTDLGVGIVIEVDGLTIFHAGDHTNGFSPDGLLPAYTAEIDYLKSLGVEPDLMFMGIRGCSLGNPDEVKRGVEYALRELEPRVFFPQHSGTNTAAYAQFVSEVRDDFPDVQMVAVEYRGDHYRFRKGRIEFMEKSCGQQAAFGLDAAGEGGE